MDWNQKRKTGTPVWRQISTQSSSSKEFSVDASVAEPANIASIEQGKINTDEAEATSPSSTYLNDALKDSEDAFGDSSTASVSQNIVGGQDSGKMTLSKNKHAVTVEAAKSPDLTYSHFISLPLAIHPEFVDKVTRFQSSILGYDPKDVKGTMKCVDGNPRTGASVDAGKVDQPEKDLAVGVKLKIRDDINPVKVDIRNIPTLHATLMKTSFRRERRKNKRGDSFDARGIFQQFGREEWGDYHIREAHLSQRSVYDDNGYYHCCASIPFPENSQVHEAGVDPAHAEIEKTQMANSA